ncbi:zonadhesin-like isoform X2 [Lutzomyia longipalpis]|uniref:zonadhesin-like isoform X2 n=1 Tax=Lutzomyia longipalpis TaxID=7200 RepID=UPI0024842C97|nr:zonadhesin-like isoform X2 [Lutzomyia longipalpis]
MDWRVLKIFLFLSYAVVLSASKVNSSEEDSLYYWWRGEPTPAPTLVESDSDRKHFSSHYQGSRPSKPTVPVKGAGPVPLPNPTPKTCPRYEEYHDCGSPCQVECSNLGQKCNVKNKRCSEGCYCIPGYARKSPNGPCVPQYKCPQPFCPVNEVWLDCFQAPACDRECTEVGKQCDSVGSSCNAGCFCRLGYARHPSTGECIPTSKCPTSNPVSEKCPWNEVFQQCEFRCTESCDTTLCSRVRQICEKGCFCKQGYARINGKCVPQASCSAPACPDNERFLECGNACTESCYKDVARCKPCDKSGCFCIEGYARIDGFCRPESQCPNKKCAANEVYSDCGTSCQDSCDPNVVCAQVCLKGCYCQPGYARVNGVCVPRSKCPTPPPPPTCKANEVYLECGGACQDDCDQLKPCTEQCVSGCFCEDGYARINGKCVPKYKCPVECPEHEHYVPCGNNCLDSCDKDLLDCSSDCYPGCYCDDGFARIDGKCVPEKYCKKCSLNEEFLKCGNACQDLCNASATQCTDQCVAGCFCQEGYSRINGVCVPRSNCFNCNSGEVYTQCGNPCLESCDRNVLFCPALCEEGCFCAPGFSRIKGQCLPNELCPTCGENEEYQNCGSHCLELCGHPPCPLDIPCNGGCFCKPGFKRLGKDCIPEDQCPAQCTNPNEVYSDCGNNCTDLCPDPNRFCTLDCYSGCFCAEGYSRPDYNSPCIPTDQCPAPTPTCSGKHEKYYDCGNSCFDDCPDPQKKCDLVCQKGCYCEANYVRLTPGGPCVPEWKCPVPCARPFEELKACGNNCTELCPRPGRACEKDCWKGCFCKKGYYRDRYNGICIPEAKCPPPPICNGPNEEIRDCGDACDDNCPGGIYFCPIDCQIGCYCKPGFKRVDPGGQCVSESLCPPVCSKPNEEYTECGNSCREKCPSTNTFCPDICERGCYCKEGYSRINGECVPTSQCPSACPDPKEIYKDCGSRCKEQCNSDICPAVCDVGCFCKPGYSRQDGTCIPTRQCPPMTCSGDNEEYTDCGNSCSEQCGNQLCAAVCQPGCFCKAGYKRVEGVCVPSSSCPTCGVNEEYTYCGSACTDPCETRGQNCYDACKEGCFCKDGYSRIKPYTPCVPDSQCPSKCTGQNEVFTKCGSSCREKCGSNLCTQICETGCYCKPGYSRQDGVCIPTSQCPTTQQCSDPNEMYTQCGNSCREKCGSKLCSQICEVGCFCKPGYSRKNGVCIPTSQCPAKEKCSGQNEIFTKCGNSCREKCGDNICPTICQVGCYCKPGYSRQDGVCIPTNQCPTTEECSGDNEIYTTCGNSCREKCGSGICPAICQTGCFCKDGYSRATPDSPCIPTDQCPATCSDPNEVYTNCGSSCKEKCGSRICPALCEVGCFCKPGYSRVKNVCVPTKKCPTCGVNEEYTYCGSGCTDPCYLKDALCKDACREGCFCKPDYSRISDGTPCVPDSQCPPIDGGSTNTTCGPYEVYTDCGRDCQTQCDTMGVKCPIVHIVCPSGCYCLPGYARIYEGGCCVPQDICPSSPCGDNEIWLECGDPPQPIPCPQNCLESPTRCTSALPSCDLPAKGACYCKQGYARAPGSTKCVPIEDCSSYPLKN